MYKLTPRQINAIKNSAKGVLPAFLKATPASVGKAAGRGNVTGAVGKSKGLGMGGSLGKAIARRIKK